MDKSRKSNRLRSATIGSLVPSKTHKIDPNDPSSWQARKSLIKTLHDDCLEYIEKDDEVEADKIIDALDALSDGSGWYEIEIVWHEPSPQTSDAFVLQVELIVRIYEKPNDENYWEFFIEQDDAAYSAHLDHAGYSKSGSYVSNISQLLA